jgi:thiol-disulfide isomerase/thioredoxin
MKRLLLLPALCLLFAGAAFAADPATDFSTLKTPDEFWAQIEKLQETPKEQPKSKEEGLAMMRAWLGAQKAAADAFADKFPEDPRRWQAKMLSLRVAGQLRRFSGQVVVLEEDRKTIAEIIAAPDAPAPIKGEAAFMNVMMFTAEFGKGGPKAFADFHQAAGDFLQKYPEHPLAAQLKSIQLRVLDMDQSPEAVELLKQFAASPDARVAGAAKEQLERRQKVTDLKSKPMDLKFTATDGKEVDLANLRGKVVLVDFWASWCGPCIAEMPNVVGTYQKLHEKGFEILGISLDEDKAAMEAALKKHEMTWAQYFDGAGWKNKISTSFGITSIPATFLIDKKGLLRETGLRGEALAAGVEKLLTE